MEQQRPSPPADRRGLRIATLLGVPVYVSATWLVIAALIVIVYQPNVIDRVPGLSEAGAYVTAATFVLLLFGSVLLHELGHAAVALRLGIGVKGMTLWMLGGYTEMESEPRTPRGEFLVAAAGPAVSATLGLASLVVLTVMEPGGIAYELARQATLSNLFVAVFNLLPGLPLDGGSLVRAAVWRLGAKRSTATAVAGWSGRAVAVAVLVAGVGIAVLARDLGSTGLLLTVAVGVFLWFGASQSIRAGAMAARLPKLQARRLARPSLTVPGDLPLAEALRRAAEAGARGLVVVDVDGAATAVVSEHAVAAIPLERRPWIPVADAARTLEPGMIIHADLSGEALLHALQAHPTTEYVVSDGSRVLGVLVALDVMKTLDPKGTT